MKQHSILFYFDDSACFSVSSCFTSSSLKIFMELERRLGFMEQLAA